MAGPPQAAGKAVEGAAKRLRGGEVREGLARILPPEAGRERGKRRGGAAAAAAAEGGAAPAAEDVGGQEVFYNRAQVFNRDTSIAVLRYFEQRRREEYARGDKHARVHLRELRKRKQLPALGAEAARNGQAAAPKLKILEALAASGLRALRYAREVAGVGEVVANDNDAAAVEHIRRNVRHNVEADGELPAAVTPSLANAQVLMLQNPKTFDVVDLDPYGTPSMFLDGAVQTVQDGGLLCVTATDMAVLCGNSGEVSWSKYGAYSLKGGYCHEMSLRILLAALEAAAVRHKRHIVPVLSVSIDFYVRVFVRVFTSPLEAKKSPSKLAYVWKCVGCESTTLQRVGRIVQKGNSTKHVPGTGPAVGAACEHCGGRFTMGGPIWAEPIHDPDWTKGILAEAVKIRDRYPAFTKLHSLLTTINEELVDAPLFMDMHRVSGVLKCTPCKSELFRSALANAGYRVSSTHCNPHAIKSDAPLKVYWDIMRAWIKDHPVKPHAKNTPGFNILAQEPETAVDFTRVNRALSKAKLAKVPRFPLNPEANWGPRARAYGNPRKGAKREGGPGEGEGAKKPRRDGAEDEGAEFL